MQTTPPETLWALPGTLVHDDARQPRLRCGRCTQCGWMAFGAPKVCARCWSEALAPHLLAPTGRLYAYSTVHRGREGWDTPYTLALVDFEDGAVRVAGPLDAPAGSALPALDSIVRVGSGPLRRDRAGHAIHAHRFVTEGAPA